MPMKKASATGAATLQPLDPNQDVLSLREARSQKRKATSPTPPEDDLDQEIQNLEMLHQQVQRKKEKMARLADLQRQIDEASEEVRHLAQDDQNRRPPHRELHQEGFYNEDDGMKISIMEILLLMILLLCRQNCRLHLGPSLTNHPSSPCTTVIQTRSNS
jgi:phosphoglycerate dehydrogenase-like enzyme